MKLILLIIGIILTITSSQNVQKETDVKSLQSSSNGTYSLYGEFASNDKGVTTIKDMDRTDTIIAYGCTYCNYYGKAIIEKKGSNYTIKQFEETPEFKQTAKVLKIANSLDKALLQISDSKPFWTEANVKSRSNKAFYIADKWVVQ